MFMTTEIKAGDDLMIKDNPNNYIKIRFVKDGQIETRKAIIDGNNSVSGRSYCVYEYIVGKNTEDAKFFDGSVYIDEWIEIERERVWDNAGNTNNEGMSQIKGAGDIWGPDHQSIKEKLYVDTMKPQATHTWIDIRDTYGYKEANGNYYLKEGGQIRVGVTFNEKWGVYDKGKSRKCLYDSK